MWPRHAFSLFIFSSKKKLQRDNMHFDYYKLSAITTVSFFVTFFLCSIRCSWCWRCIVIRSFCFIPSWITVVRSVSPFFLHQHLAAFASEEATSNGKSLIAVAVLSTSHDRCTNAKSFHPSHRRWQIFAVLLSWDSGKTIQKPYCSEVVSTRFVSNLLCLSLDALRRPCCCASPFRKHIHSVVHHFWRVVSYGMIFQIIIVVLIHTKVERRETWRSTAHE